MRRLRSITLRAALPEGVTGDDIVDAARRVCDGAAEGLPDLPVTPSLAFTDEQAEVLRWLVLKAALEAVVRVVGGELRHMEIEFGDPRSPGRRTH